MAARRSSGENLNRKIGNKKREITRYWENGNQEEYLFRPPGGTVPAVTLVVCITISPYHSSQSQGPYINPTRLHPHILAPRGGKAILVEVT